MFRLLSTRLLGRCSSGGRDDSAWKCSFRCMGYEDKIYRAFGRAYVLYSSFEPRINLTM